MIDDGLVGDYEGMWTIDLEDIVLEKVIGKGAFGEVYLGNYLGTAVAVKKISSQNEEDELYLQREVTVLKTMRHPNIVLFMGACRRVNDLYIVTEYVEKGSLRGVLKSSNEISWIKRGKIALDIACAMAYLHARKIIFRDLKSKNILIDSNLRAKICDFGFARLNEQRGARAMTLCGTDDWMAPEVILGMDYDAKADVFSYGIVLFEIITREKVSVALQRSPMDAFDLDERKTRNLLPKECPPDFAELAFRCCRYEPNQRPDFKQIVADLANMIKTFPVPVKPNAARGAPSPRGAPALRSRGAPMQMRGANPPPGVGSPRGGVQMQMRGGQYGAPGSPYPRNF